MIKREWYYLDGNTQVGPISEQKIKEMLFTGSLDQKTFIWTECLENWEKAKDVEILKDISSVTTDEIDANLHEEESVSKSTQKKMVRPWLRYWARQMDYLCGGLVMMLLVSPTYFANDAVFGFISMFLWIFWEGMLLSTWGWTPGKYFLKIRVRDSRGEKLKFIPALNRSFKVWVMGMGCGIPVLSLIVMVWNYFSLKKMGITYWDANGGLEVVHEDEGWQRVTIIIIAVFLLIFWAFMFGFNASVDGQSILPVNSKVYV